MKKEIYIMNMHTCMHVSYQLYSLMFCPQKFYFYKIILYYIAFFQKEFQTYNCIEL